jgi:effector-binding domain-containing protein
MKILKGLLIVVFAFVALFFIVTFFLPSHYEIKRTVEIQSPVSMVFYLVDDLRNWKHWDAWYGLDTNQVRIYEGPLFGKNAAYKWTSKERNVGNGELKIVEEEPFKKIKTSMIFESSMRSDGEFTFDEKDGKTIVTWRMWGEFSFLAKWFRFFMEETAGKDFEKGLANIKKIAEEAVRNKVVFFVDSLPNIKLVFVSDSTSVNPQEISQKYGQCFLELFDFTNKNKVEIIGGPIAITKSYTKTSYVFDAAFPVKSFEGIKPEGRIQFGEISASKVLRTVFLGSYDEFEEVYGKIHNYLNSKKFQIRGNFFEMYYTDPEKVPPKHNVTIIFTPIE